MVLSGQPQDRAETTHVKSLKMAFLVPVCCPRFTTIEQHTDNTGHVHLDFNSDGEVAVGPNTWTKLTKPCSGLAYANVKLRFQGVRVVDCVPQVTELVN